jgi:hypothetical protein
MNQMLRGKPGCYYRLESLRMPEAIPPAELSHYAPAPDFRRTVIETVAPGVAGLGPLAFK